MKALDAQSKDLAGVAYLDEAGHYKDGGVVDVPQLDEVSCHLPMNQRKWQSFRSGFYTTKPVEGVLSVVPIACPVLRQGYGIAVGSWFSRNCSFL